MVMTERTTSALIALALAVVSAGCGGDDEATTTAAGGSGSGDDVPAEIAWSHAELSKDGATLFVSFGGAAIGDGPCEARYEHGVDESSDRVTVRVASDRPTTTTTGGAPTSPPPPPPPAQSGGTGGSGAGAVGSSGAGSGPAGCPAVGHVHLLEVTLERPLDDRPVFNGIDDGPRPVADRSDAVEVTHVPETFTSEGPFPLVDDGQRDSSDQGEVGWQQIFSSPSEPFTIYVIQRREGQGSDLGPVIESTTVHGQPAEIQEWFNGTAHSVLWTEDGWDLVVTVELHASGAPPYDHRDDELLRIAEGIRLPE